MIFRWLGKLLHLRKAHPNGSARHARETAERKRRQVQRLWPQTKEAREQLTVLIENALRGNR